MLSSRPHLNRKNMIATVRTPYTSQLRMLDFTPLEKSAPFLTLVLPGTPRRDGVRPLNPSVVTHWVSVQFLLPPEPAESYSPSPRMHGALASEAVLAHIWDKLEEDEAWQHL